MLTLDPVLVPIPGQGPPSTRVALPLGGPWTAMAIANESPYAIVVQVGGLRKWISAYTSDLLELPLTTGEFTFQPTLIASAVNAPSSQLLITLAQAGETLPGSYPTSLNRLTSLSAGAVQITAGTVTLSGPVDVKNPAGGILQVGQNQRLLGSFTVPVGIGPDVPYTFAVDPEAHTLRFYVSTTSAPLNAAWIVAGGVSGNQLASITMLSGQHYAELIWPSSYETSVLVQGVRNNLPFTVQVIEILDVQALQVEPGRGTLPVALYASPAVNGPPLGTGRQLKANSLPVADALQPYDWTLTIRGAIGVQALLSQAAPNQVTMLDFVTFTIFNSGAGAGAANALILLGGVEVWSAAMAALSGGGADRLVLSGLHYGTVSGGILNVKFDGGIAGAAQYISAGGWLLP